MQATEQGILSQIKIKVLEKAPNAEVILFGSRARGDARPGSDWDILVLLNLQKISIDMEKEIRHSVYSVSIETGEPISIFVKSKFDWEGRYAVTPFYQNIKEDGIII